MNGFRYEEEPDERDRKYRTKKRRVNKKTEQVYLQRLVASSERKTRLSKNKRLDF